jgi:hypothetical protein
MVLHDASHSTCVFSESRRVSKISRILSFFKMKPYIFHKPFNAFFNSLHESIKIVESKNY